MYEVKCNESKIEVRVREGVKYSGSIIVRGGGFVCEAPSELSDVRVPPGISIGGFTRGCTSQISIGGETSSALKNCLILLQILCECKGESLYEKDQTKANELTQAN